MAIRLYQNFRLRSAAEWREHETARDAISKGANPNTRSILTGKTPLMSAHVLDDEEMKVLLRDAGATITKKESDKAVLLRYADTSPVTLPESFDR